MTVISRFLTATASASAAALVVTTPSVLAPSPASAGQPVRTAAGATAAAAAAAALPAPAVSARVSGRTTVRLGSYNIHKDDAVLPWTPKRRKRVAAQILGGDFDVVALQEANGNTIFPSLRRAVDHRFATNARCAKVKGTKIRDTRARILYDPTRFTGSRAVSGRIQLDRSGSAKADFACYQLLTERRTGARFLVVSTHLINGASRAKDLKRYRQTHNMISDTLAVRRRHSASWPIVWAGDYNSSASRRYTFDAPRRAMRQMASARDSFAVARTRRNGSYNSANQLRRRPWRTRHHIDHVYVSPGITVPRFRVLVRLDGRLYRVPWNSDHNPIKATLRIPY